MGWHGNNQGISALLPVSVSTRMVIRRITSPALGQHLALQP